MAEISKEMGQRFRVARERAGLSLSQVCNLFEKRTSVQRTQEWLKGIEDAQVTPYIEELPLLAEIYGVDARWIYTGESLHDIAEIEKSLKEMSKDDLESVIDFLSSLSKE